MSWPEPLLIAGLPELLATTLAVILGAAVVAWLASLALRDASIVDPLWGPGFALIAWIGFFGADGFFDRRLLLAALTTVWGLRLGLYLAWRNRGEGEDFRYRAMREHWGGAFSWVSLFTVFLLQAALMWLISAPVQLGQAAGRPAEWTWLDGIGTLLWSAGLVFESVADWQLARFKADPDNEGKVLDTGLWAWSRHPNYFGDALVWWGIGTVAAATPAGRWGLFGPALMTFLLLRVSGVALLEREITDRRPAYREYIERTSAFFPRPPRRSG